MDEPCTRTVLSFEGLEISAYCPACGHIAIVHDRKGCTVCRVAADLIARVERLENVIETNRERLGLWDGS